MLKDRQLIMAKPELPAGTDAVPVPATNAILAQAIDITAVGRRISRGAAYPYMGVPSPLNVGEAVKVKFTTEIKGKAGAADVPPEIGVLFKGCNFTETINTAVSVVYSPNSSISGNTTLTIYASQHDLLHKIIAARGTFNFDLTTAEYGKIVWEFTGIYAGPIDSPIPAAPTFTAALPPRFLSANFTLAGYAATISKLTGDMQNKIVKRVDANSTTGIKEWLITDRNPKGSVDPEMVTVATKDLWGLWADSTGMAINATLGSAVGNKCVIAIPNAVADLPSYADRENWLTLNMPFTMHPSAGNDEVTFTFQ